MKAVVAKYDAVELITHRDRVSAEIRERLTERAGNYYLVPSSHLPPPSSVVPPHTFAFR